MYKENNSISVQEEMLKFSFVWYFLKISFEYSRQLAIEFVIEQVLLIEHFCCVKSCLTLFVIFLKKLSFLRFNLCVNFAFSSRIVLLFSGEIQIKSLEISIMF